MWTEAMQKRLQELEEQHEAFPWTEYFDLQEEQKAHLLMEQMKGRPFEGTHWEIGEGIAVNAWLSVNLFWLPPDKQEGLLSFFPKSEYHDHVQFPGGIHFILDDNELHLSGELEAVLAFTKEQGISISTTPLEKAVRNYQEEIEGITKKIERVGQAQK